MIPSPGTHAMPGRGRDNIFYAKVPLFVSFGN
jgi:hypothetical protein